MNKKKTPVVLLSLLLAGALAGCAAAPQPQSGASAASAPASGSGQPSASEEKAAQETSPSAAPAETSEPDTAPYSGVLRVVNEETAPDVRVCHVADDAFNQPGLVSYEIIDLSTLDFYHEFSDAAGAPAGDDGEPARIIFMVQAPVKDFRYLEVETVLDETLGIIPGATLYQLDALTPEAPFVVNWISIGDIGMARGISYVDADGATRYFSFNISGNDGDMVLMEFVPE